MLGKKIIHLPQNGTPTGRELIAKGIKVETDMLIHDKRALVPLSLEESALVPRRELFPLERFWWKNTMIMGIDL